MNPNYSVLEIMVSSLAGYLNQGYVIVGSPYLKKSYMSNFETSTGRTEYTVTGEQTYVLIVKQN